MSAVLLHRVVDAAPDLPPGAPTVLMLGSLGSTLAMWEPQVAGLSQRFRVVRLDLRGHGRSPVPPAPYDVDGLADDLLLAMDDLGLARAHLVGLSLGAMAMMRLASAHPERVDRVAVICTSARLGPAQLWLDRAAAVRAHGTASIAATVVQRWFTPAYGQARPDVLRAMEQMVGGTPAEGYAACSEAIARMDQRATLPQLTAPLLAIAGADDPATPPEHLRLIAEAVPHGRLVVLEDAAHLASYEQADAVTAALLEHLDPADRKG